MTKPKRKGPQMKDPIKPKSGSSRVKKKREWKMWCCMEDEIPYTLHKKYKSAQEVKECYWYHGKKVKVLRVIVREI